VFLPFKANSTTKKSPNQIELIWGSTSEKLFNSLFKTDDPKTFKIGIDIPKTLLHDYPSKYSGALASLIGNAVKIGDRPSAVIGDKICIMPLFGLKPGWEGAGIRMIRKSEDLPG
jgi:hypothetical protein